MHNGEFIEATEGVVMVADLFNPAEWVEVISLNQNFGTAVVRTTVRSDRTY